MVSKFRFKYKTNSNELIILYSLLFPWFSHDFSWELKLINLFQFAKYLKRNLEMTEAATRGIPWKKVFLQI